MAEDLTAYHDVLNESFPGVFNVDDRLAGYRIERAGNIYFALVAQNPLEGAKAFNGIVLGNEEDSLLTTFHSEGANRDRKSEKNEGNVIRFLWIVTHIWNHYSKLKLPIPENMLTSIPFCLTKDNQIIYEGRARES